MHRKTMLHVFKTHDVRASPSRVRLAHHQLLAFVSIVSTFLLMMCLSVQVVQALESLLSKAAAAAPTSASAPSSTAATLPVSQSQKQTLFHIRCQWSPVVASLNVEELSEVAGLPVTVQSASGTKSAKPSAR